VENAVMRSRFAQFAVMENQNPVAALDCRKPVGDDQRSSFLHNALNGSLN